MSLDKFLAAAAEPTPLPVVFGVVTAVNLAGTPPSCTVVLGGQTVPTPGIRCTSSCPAPAIDDNVVLLRNGPDLILVCSLAV